MTNKDEAEREAAVDLVYRNAADLLERAREVVRLHDWCLEKFGQAPSPLDDEVRRIAAMRDVDELLNDPVQGLRSERPIWTH